MARGTPRRSACIFQVGFRQIGLIEGSGYKHGRWLDTVLMQRALGPGATSDPAEISS
jgi:phosphinothricin acetyltransferase